MLPFLDIFGLLLCSGLLITIDKKCTQLILKKIYNKNILKSVSTLIELGYKFIEEKKIPNYDSKLLSQIVDENLKKYYNIIKKQIKDEHESILSRAKLEAEEKLQVTMNTLKAEVNAKSGSDMQKAILDAKQDEDHQSQALYFELTEYKLMLSSKIFNSFSLLIGT
mgnify:CR=1 FL=1